MKGLNRIFSAVKPSLADRRDERHLLVWGELAQWMVVNGEVCDFLELFDGKRKLKEILRKHSLKYDKQLPVVEKEAWRVIEEFLDRGILTKNDKPPVIYQEPEKIANITINLTNRCNLKCRWCYNAERNSGEMPVDALMDAVISGRDVFDKSVSLIILGGEPTIDMERLTAAVDRWNENFQQMPMISTNGTVLTDKAVEMLASREVEVQVSLDSHIEHVHDSIRGQGVFRKAVDGVRKLVDAGVYTILSMVYTSDRIEDFEGYLDMAESLGVDEARFIPMRVIGKGLAERKYMPDQSEALEHLLDVLDRRPELARFLKRDYFSISLAVCRFSSPRVNCGIGRRVIFIDADGKVYPCPNHVLPEFLAGDLGKENLGGIFAESEVMKQVREQYIVTAYRGCSECAFRFWCAGDCRGEVLSADGKRDIPSPHCKELRNMYLRILWLIADGDNRLGPMKKVHEKDTVDTFLV